MVRAMASKSNFDEVVSKLSFVPVRKKSYEISVCRPAAGTPVHNFLEDVNYTTSVERPFVLKGTAGEMWVVDFAKLFKTYMLADGTPIKNDLPESKLGLDMVEWVKIKTKPAAASTNFAALLPLRVAKEFPVSTSWGDTLLANRNGIPHGEGDYLVCLGTQDGKPNFNDMWVVNGLVFKDTYEEIRSDGGQVSHSPVSTSGGNSRGGVKKMSLF